MPTTEAALDASYCVAARLLHKVPDAVAGILFFPAICRTFNEWAMLGSNQRPLPCEGRSITS